eukprot:gene12749-23207_t
MELEPATARVRISSDCTGAGFDAITETGHARGWPVTAAAGGDDGGGGGETEDLNNLFLQPEGEQHLIMHKPALCLTSTCDGMAPATRPEILRRQRSLGVVGATRTTVVDVLQANGIDPSTVSAVGRLDYETSGLLLFTSNGTLNNRIRAKSTHVVKTYELDVAGNIDAAIDWIGAHELRGEAAAMDPWPWCVASIEWHLVRSTWAISRLGSAVLSMQKR